MLRKLLKYELKGTARYYLPLFGAIVLFSIINSVYSGIFTQKPGWINGALIFIEVILLIALMVMTFVITVQRFYKNLLGNEGYLMFTLPVSAHHNILSKLLAAMLWNIATLGTITRSIVIISRQVTDIISLIKLLWQNLIHFFQIDALHATLMLVQWMSVGLLGVAVSILYLYLSMSIGQLANDHKFLASFGAYLGIQAIMSVLSSVIGSVINTLPKEWIQGVYRWFGSFGYTGGAQVITLVIAMITIAGGAISYFITHWLLKHKLNLT
jgi:hypothetical protein